MGGTIYVRCGELGDRAEMPALKYDKEKGSEIGLRTDEEALYVGTSKGNIRMCGANDVRELNAKIDAINALIENITARLDALSPSE